MPFLSIKSKDYLIQVASNIVSILHKYLSFTIPTLKASNDMHNILLKLAIILKKVDNIPNLQILKEVSSLRVPIIQSKMFAGNN